MYPQSDSRDWRNTNGYMRFQLTAPQITAVAAADAAFPLVKHSSEGPLLALTSLLRYAQPGARAILGQHAGHEVEDCCGSAIWH